MLVLIGAFVSVDRHKTAVLLITWANPRPDQLDGQLGVNVGPPVQAYIGVSAWLDLRYKLNIAFSERNPYP
jgi:hypothetical protein